LVANAAALINEGLWRKDKEFQKLPRLAQCTFCQVLSCKDLDTAGVLTLNMDLLAKACEELTVEQLRADFAVLEGSRFLFVDYDTDELFIRSYVRRVSVKNRNSWHSVPKNSRLVASEKIRHELATELRRLNRKDASEVADEIDPVGTPSEPPPDPVSTTSRSGTPSQPPRDGDSQVPVLVQGSSSVGGSVGERPPRPECPDHEENSEGRCGPCMRRRRWDEKYADQVEADELELRRRWKAIEAEALRDCLHCDDDGWILAEDGTPAEPAMKCQIHLQNLKVVEVS
jgi:hypothetical protein